MSTDRASNDARRLMNQVAPAPALGRLLGVLATTYNLQPEFLEADFLPTLLGLTAWDDRSWSSRIALEKRLAELEAAAVLMEAGAYAGRPRSLRVELVPVALARGSSLHAKVTVGVFEEGVRLTVGSANLTEPGYRRNREVAAVLTATADRPGDARLIADAIRGMADLLESRMTAGAKAVRDLALERLKAWEGREGEGLWFAWSGGRPALWQRFLDCWPSKEQVRKISVLSPFWSEEDRDGPIAWFIAALSARGCLAKGAELLLLTEAALDTQSTWKPKLPESFHDFDGRAIGIDASAMAVDRKVAAEEADLGDGFAASRDLHAKAVLMEGEDSALLYAGSANFTRHGWGFLPDPSRANIEAGVVLRKSGDACVSLASILPATVGKAVALSGAATGQIVVLELPKDEPPWPSFLLEVVLAQSQEDDTRLDLVVRTTGKTTGAWKISHMPDGEARGAVLLDVEQATSRETARTVRLTSEDVSRLLREQQVQVHWWEHPAGRPYPVNVVADARIKLPIDPGSGRLEERQLIAYYQGRISFEDLYPDPDEPPGPGPGPGERGMESAVDTSKIQSYLVKEFVEALQGIREDLMEASKSTPQCMRLALLGPVSPVALARQVHEAVGARTRTATAAGFQLVEILACLESAREAANESRFRRDWRALVGAAAAEIERLLERLRQDHPEELGREFRKYAAEVRTLYVSQRGGG